MTISIMMTGLIPFVLIACALIFIVWAGRGLYRNNTKNMND
jgi:hypothetical protein